MESQETKSVQQVRGETARGIVEAVRRGDVGAFAELYRQHAPMVQSLVRSRTHDRDLAADVVQEVFTRALEALPGLKRPELFRPWLASIARHVTADALRTRGRTEPFNENFAAQTPSNEAGPGPLVELSELAELVRGVVGGLHQRDATAVGLVQLGFSVEDVATALGITHGAAKVALHRARRRLRDALVLQVMVRTGGAACEEFRTLRDGGDARALAGHAKTCRTCSAAARAHAFG
jgi:RNA polymerase sigma-70 factor, ECF subfamily